METLAAVGILMIREATRADIPKIVEMGKRFREESTYKNYLTENPTRMAEVADQLIQVEGLLVSEQGEELTGMLGFIVYSHFMSGERVAGEVFWWVSPEHAGSGPRLLKEMEKRVRAAGAKHTQMIAPNGKVARFYERMGYEFVESTYQRAL